MTCGSFRLCWHRLSPRHNAVDHTVITTIIMTSTLEHQLQIYREKLASFKEEGNSASTGFNNNDNDGNNRGRNGPNYSNGGHPRTLTRQDSTATDGSGRGGGDKERIADAGGGAVFMFNYDDDFDKHGELTGEEPEEEALTWRSDPSRSLSDWTILVSNRETQETHPYHVHRNVLAVGPRKSEYFVRFFLSHDRMSKSSKSTEIWFSTVAANTMPQLLDYMYSSDGKLDISTECAVGLRHLAQFFGMRALHKKVMNYITSDLTMDNVLTYYQHTVAVDDAKVSEIASAHCAKHVMDIGLDDPLLGVVDALFIRQILTLSNQVDSVEQQLHTSQLLAEYCRQHRKTLDDQDFIRLTDERCLRRVHYSAALTLMEMEADLVLLDQHDVDVIEETTSLQNRCLADLTKHWEQLGQMQPAELTRICRKLPSAVVTEIMVRSLGQAKEQLGSSASSSSSSGQQQQKQQQQQGSDGDSDSNDSDVRSEYEAKLANLKRQHQVTLEKIKREFEANLMKMKEAVIEKCVYIITIVFVFVCWGGGWEV